MRSPLLTVLRDPQQALQFDVRDWSATVRDAHRNKLLCRLACDLQDRGHMYLPPENLQRRLQGAVRTARGSRRSVRWEVRKIYQALHGAGIDFVLLKGAAYEMADLPASSGRLYGDIDIMVRREQVERAEDELFQHGWISMKLDAYDQRYYRQWMHEIPPLHNTRRDTSLDLHHTILPPTAALKPSVALLWQGAQELPYWPGMYVLGPLDMILHSATHLFHDGDLDAGLRDLLDLDDLLRLQAGEDGFWDDLLLRAQQQDLVQPVYYALRYTRKLLGTPVPATLLARAEILAALPPLAVTAMDRLVMTALEPSRATLDSRAAGFGRWLLYLRSHRLRMPLHLLLPHLLRKALGGDG